MPINWQIISWFQAASLVFVIKQIMTNVNVKRNLLLVLVFLTLRPIFTHQQQTEIDWWQNAVIYQIYPRSYQDSNDDGIGDLKGVTSRLSHLSEMGVKATWLSPIFKSPMVDFGYDISDFLQIQEEYGTMDDFQEMIDQADRLGNKILLDLVPNHSSDQSEWFKKSVAREEGYEDFYIWADGKIDEDGNRLPPNNWQSVFYGSAWTWNDVRQQFYLHQFAVEQPDLNYRNPSVVEAMDNIILFWLDKGVSGFRVDAVCHLFEVEDLLDEPISGKTNDPKSYDYTLHYHTKDLPEVYELIQHWRELLDEYTNDVGGPTRIMITEAYANMTSTMEYYEDERGRKGSHFPFNFLMITDLNDQSNARDFVFNIQKWITYMPKDYTANWVLGNHDTSRVASRYNPQLVDALHILVMTLPGVVITYNGEEIGMVDLKNISWEDTRDPPALNVGRDNYQKFSRDPVRTPFQWDATKNAGFSNADKTWLPIHPEYETLNLAAQKEASKSHYKLYKKLIQLRESPVLQRGFLTINALSRNVLAVKRQLKGQATIISVINVSSNEEVVNLKLLGDLPNKLTVLAAASESLYEEGTIVTSDHLVMIRFDGVILQGLQSISDERRELIKTIIKSANIILVGLLMYKLWDNKWTKLNFNKAARF